MSLWQITFWWAVSCALGAYLLPLILWVKRRPAFPTVVLAVPALIVGSWWFAEWFDFRAGRVGFTFYGALPAAIVSNLLILALIRGNALQARGPLWTAFLVLGCLITGIVLEFLLPPLAE